MALLSATEKESFYNDGFLVLRNIIPLELVLRARRKFFQSMGTFWHSSVSLAHQLGTAGQEQRDAAVTSFKQIASSATPTGTDDEIQQLVSTESELRKVIDELMGEGARGFQFAQLAYHFPTSPTRQINESGYPDEDVPFYGWHGHLDGLWNGATRIHQRVDRKMTKEEWTRWNNGRGQNGVERAYPEQNTTVTNFTGLLGIPLSDQSSEGVGNLALLRGAHHHFDRFFRFQRDEGGPLGPDGPEWPRVDTDAPNGCGLRHYPEYVREQYRDGAGKTSDGRIWPRPTLIKMNLGDALLVLHAVPHSSTRCEGAEPRLMSYFRLTSASRPKEMGRVHPDALCDCWMEWPGMRETVARMREQD